MAENKRVCMKATPVRIDVSNPAGSIQAHIDAEEAKGNYVMQYIAVSQFDGVLLCHDYPDRKNNDGSEAKKKAEPKPEPTPETAPAATENLTTREEPVKAAPAPQGSNLNPKGKGKKK